MQSTHCLHIDSIVQDYKIIAILLDSYICTLTLSLLAALFCRLMTLQTVWTQTDRGQQNVCPDPNSNCLTLL